VIDEHDARRCFPSRVFTSCLEVRCNPGRHRLWAAHAILRVGVDERSLSAIGDQGQDVLVDLSTVPEVCLVAVQAVVELLEVLVVHLIGNLRKRLPCAEIHRHVVHLVIYTHERVIQGVHHIVTARQSAVAELLSVGDTRVVGIVDQVLEGLDSSQVVRHLVKNGVDSSSLRFLRVDRLLDSGPHIRRCIDGQVNLGVETGFKRARRLVLL